MHCIELFVISARIIFNPHIELIERENHSNHQRLFNNKLRNHFCIVRDEWEKAITISLPLHKRAIVAVWKTWNSIKFYLKEKIIIVLSFFLHILTSDTMVWVGIIKALSRGNHLTSFSFSSPVSRYRILISLKLFQNWSLRNLHIFSSSDW